MRHRAGIATALPAALALLLMVAVPPTWGDEASGSPHHGTDACPICHNDDMSLQRSKLETCTFCHGGTPHSGAAEHLRLDASRVERALSGRKDKSVELPLTDDRRIWCGTCHLFHDPSLGEPWLTNGWVPPDSGLPNAVRNGVTARWDAIAAAHGQKEVGAAFANKGTRQLRLPVEDGTLCLQCHGGYVR